MATKNEIRAIELARMIINVQKRIGDINKFLRMKESLPHDVNKIYIDVFCFDESEIENFSYKFYTEIEKYLKEKLDTYFKLEKQFQNEFKDLIK